VSADKLERLLNLTALLLDTGRPLSRESIRERLPGYAEGDEAFRRQFERDKDDLRRMGIPLVVEPVPGQLPEIDGYRIPADRYYLADPGLRPDELAALHLAASAVRVEGLPAAEGLRKLGAEPPDGGADVEPLGVHIAALPGDANLGVLFGAVAAHQPVELEYRGDTRRVDPYRLDLRRGRWYLSGYDHARGEVRSYRLDRIEGTVRVLDEPAFERPVSGRPGAEREPWELGEGEPIKARVRIDGPPATWAVHHLGPGAVVEQDDDGVVVELEVAHRDGFRSFVLSFLDHAEVLSPPELRDETIAWLTQITGEPAR
jgi:proteasome accessory factor B